MNQIDNRGSHFYLAMYWSEELAKQSDDSELQTFFDRISIDLKNNEDQIIRELNNAQGRKEDLEGYYFPDTAAVFSAMRPSETLNHIIDLL